jgi:hypothetical protein
VFDKEMTTALHSSYTYLIKIIQPSIVCFKIRCKNEKASANTDAFSGN